MTDDDELRARLARIDPMHRLDASEPTASRTAHEIRERIMDTIDQAAVTSQPASPQRWRRPALAVAAAASVAAIAIGATLVGGGDSAPTKTNKEPTTLALTVPGGGDGGATMNSCLMFDVTILAGMPVALAGTVIETDASGVTIDVDRWYKGGTADRVTIAKPAANTSVSLDGVEFTQGQRYLVTATNGEVNGCGFSGPATPDLEKSFGEAFPS